MRSHMYIWIGYAGLSSTWDLVSNASPQFSIKLRHIDIHDHWLQQEVLAESIKIRYIGTMDIAANGRTKILARQEHKTFIEQLKMVDIIETLASKGM